MIKKNLFKVNHVDEKNCHGGEGAIKFCRVLEKEFQSNISFIDYTILPPGTTIGFHNHPTSEEVYIILKGKGIMTVDKEVAEVVEGDVILNPRGSSHGLENHTANDIEILVFEGGFQ